ncbi:hypothetical protein OH77DRAFT_726548 [Trametes cingulata]|nr:hypothetical protein OH77DRAFT_726548 [Trametes cingulata]
MPYAFPAPPTRSAPQIPTPDYPSLSFSGGERAALDYTDVPVRRSRSTDGRDSANGLSIPRVGNRCAPQALRRCPVRACGTKPFLFFVVSPRAVPNGEPELLLSPIHIDEDRSLRWSSARWWHRVLSSARASRRRPRRRRRRRCKDLGLRAKNRHLAFPSDFRFVRTPKYSTSKLRRVLYTCFPASSLSAV